MTEKPSREIDNTPCLGPGARPAPGFDGARIEAAVRELLIGMGEDPDRDHRG